MRKTKKLSNSQKVCKLPREPGTKEALLGLVWLKAKEERPKWLIKELSKYVK